MAFSAEPAGVVTGGAPPGMLFAAVTPPLHLSTTYAFEAIEREGPYAYGRAGNPSRDLLGRTLAQLEGGAGAVVTSSGMAALDLVLSCGNFI